MTSSDEELRKKMGEVYECGDIEEALKLSEMLDKLIVDYMKRNSRDCKYYVIASAKDKAEGRCVRCIGC